MKTLILSIGLIIFQPWSLVWGISYRLQLKNGNELTTSRYWEEGHEIRFYIYGGIAGIPKEFIINIDIANIILREDRDKDQNEIKQSDQKTEENTKSQINSREDEIGGGSEKSRVVDSNYYREKKASLKEKLEDALEKNREATRRKDQEAKRATRQEMLEYAKQLHALEDELKEKNKGTLPEWWKE